MTTRLPTGRPGTVVFLGTPDAAVPSLVALVDAGLPVGLVVTRFDARRGRREAPTPSPVKQAALALGIPVSHDLVDVADAASRVRDPLGVVVAYGKIIPSPILDLVPMVNLHFSLLPRWRGAAPVERAILAGDGESGACVMELVAELDAGPVHSCIRTPIGNDESASDLRARLASLGAQELARCCVAGFGEGREQVGVPTHAAKIRPSDLAVDWSGAASVVLRQVRVGGAHTVLWGVRTKIVRARVARPADSDAGIPGAVTRGPDGEVVAQCGEGAVELVDVQQEGRRVVNAGDWWNGTVSSRHETVRFG